MSVDLNKYLVSMEDTNLLRRFAHLGNKDAFNKKLLYLEKLAEHEKWRFRDPDSPNGEMNVLFYYIVHTFDQCFKQGRVVISNDEDAAAFNTGLMTEAGEEILAVFTQFTHYKQGDPSTNYWYLYGFFKASDRYPSLAFSTMSL